MGMSMHIEGFIPKDEKFNKMLNVYKSCTEADIEPPEEVIEFFDGETYEAVKDLPGIEVELDKNDMYQSYSADMKEGFDIFLESIPENIKVIRVYNSY